MNFFFGGKDRVFFPAAIDTNDVIRITLLPKMDYSSHASLVFFHYIETNNVGALSQIMHEDDEWVFYRNDNNEDAVSFMLRLQQIDVAFAMVGDVQYEILSQAEAVRDPWSHRDRFNDLIDFAISFGKYDYVRQNYLLTDHNPIRRIYILLRGRYEFGSDLQSYNFDLQNANWPFDEELSMMSFLIHSYYPCLENLREYMRFINQIELMIRNWIWREEIDFPDGHHALDRLLRYQQTAYYLNNWEVQGRFLGDCWRNVFFFLF